MKKIKFLSFFLFCVFSFCLVACSDDNGTIPTPEPEPEPEPEDETEDSGQEEKSGPIVVQGDLFALDDISD